MKCDLRFTKWEVPGGGVPFSALLPAQGFQDVRGAGSQGSTEDGATPGWETEARWDWRDDPASTLQTTPHHQDTRW